MKLPQFSIRSSLGIIIVLMGVLSMALALLTGEIYRKLALENQRASLKHLIAVEVDDILHDLVKRSRDLGLSIQHGKAFHAAIAAKDKQAITNILNDQFHRYFVTAGVVKLRKLYAYDQHFNLIAESSEDKIDVTPNAAACPNLITRAKQRHGAQRFQIASELCLYRGQPLQGVIVPTGGLRVSGYVVVITDPTHNLLATESSLGLALEISLPNGQLLYRSKHWPRARNMGGTLLAQYTLRTPRAEPAVRVAVVSDIRKLNEALSSTRRLVVLVASCATVITVIIALLIFQKTTFRPLQTLTRQLRLVRQDRSHLGEKVLVGGNSEIIKLAADFNDMASELDRLYTSLETHAFTDSLTELPNRTLFNDRLQQTTLLCERQARRFALLMMDLNRFKEVNDALGHQVGDKLLQQVASRLDEALRKSDTLARMADNTVARLGGDEFAAILPTVDRVQDAIVVTDRIQKVLRDPIVIEGHALKVDVSIGIVMYPEHGNEGSTLLQRADVAMYQAKRDHLGFAVYDSGRDNNSLSQLMLISDLKSAVENDELVLHYQPKIDMKSGKVVAAEALVRWQHPARGLIFPDEFIFLAEQTGLIRPLTNWVLEKAALECAHWHAEGSHIGVTVNLSMRNLYDSQMSTVVANALENAHLEPKWLCLELTESAVMTDSQRALQVLTGLDESGIKLAIDDFGTGYSSLAYLKKLPVDEIKIDRSFVMDMRQDNSDAIIVRSTIDLAHNMSLKVAAEGVENQETWNLLVEQGCDLAQGYYMGRPLSSPDFKEWVRNSPWGLGLERNSAVVTRIGG